MSTCSSADHPRRLISPNLLAGRIQGARKWIRGNVSRGYGATRQHFRGRSLYPVEISTFFVANKGIAQPEAHTSVKVPYGSIAKAFTAVSDGRLYIAARSEFEILIPTA